MAGETLRQPKNKIQRKSVVDQVYEAIKSDILDHVWAVGDKIPSEGELADYFGVNRLSVRMALQKLNTLGLIETKVGEGSYVADFSLQPFMEEIAPIYQTMERRKDVEQLRNLLEGECMNIAIQFATEEQKEGLKQKLDAYTELETLYNQDVDNMDLLSEVVEADFAFHYEIICMSGNRLYMDVYKMMKSMITSHIRYLVYTRSHRDVGQKLMKEYSHGLIYDSIVNGDAEKAKKAREKMLNIIPPHPADYYEEYDMEISKML